ncbi:MAG TPA: phage holin family protein [Candidatus Paceibacterota bacterium]
MELILRILWNALGLLLIAEFMPGIDVESFGSAVIAAIILGLLNAFVKPVLFLLTLPITIFTLGLFALVINAAIFLFAASFLEGFTVENFWYALLGSLLMSIVSTIGSKWLGSNHRRQ